MLGTYVVESDRLRDFVLVRVDEDEEGVDGRAHGEDESVDHDAGDEDCYNARGRQKGRRAFRGAPSFNKMAQRTMLTVTTDSAFVKFWKLDEGDRHHQTLRPPTRTAAWFSFHQAREGANNFAYRYEQRYRPLPHRPLHRPTRTRTNRRTGRELPPDDDRRTC